MRIMSFLFGMLMVMGLALASCGGNQTPANPGSGGGGTNGGTLTGLQPGTGGTTTNPSFCTGTYRYVNGAQFQIVILYSDSSCEIDNNAGVVEAPSQCTFSQSGTQLTINSSGVSVVWSIASNCSTLSPSSGITYTRQ